MAPRTGVVNIFLGKMGVGSIDFLQTSGLYVATYIALGLWKEMVGIQLFILLITGINPEYMKRPKLTDISFKENLACYFTGNTFYYCGPC